MNFTGQYRKQRSINLGGRSSASRDSILKKAQADRDKRERQRLEDRSVRTIQRFYRAKRAVARLRLDILQEWDLSYLNERTNGVGLQSPAVIERMLLQVLVMRELFFDPVQVNGSTRLARLVQLLAESEPLLSEIKRNLWARILDSLNIVLLDLAHHESDVLHALQLIMLVSPYCIQDLNRALGQLWNYVAQKNDKQLQYLYFQCLRTTAGFNSIGFFINIMSKGKQALDFLNDMFFKDQNPVILAATQTGDSWAKEEAAFANLTPRERLNVVATVMHVLPMSDTYLEFVTSLLSRLNIKVRSTVRYAAYDSDSEDDDDDDKRGISFYDDFQRSGFDKLYNVAVYESVFRQAIEGSRKNTLSDLVPIADFFSSLMQIYPEKSSQIVLVLIALSDQHGSAIRILWQVLSTSNLFALLKNGDGNLPSVASLEEEFVESQGSWPILKLMLRLMQYWLIVADDREFFEKPSLGLPLEETKIMTEFLKNWCYCIIWHWKTLKQYVATDFPELKSFSIVVLRQLYIRDSRRSFLKSHFWQMFGSVDLLSFTPIVIQEEMARLAKLANEQDDQDTTEEDIEPRVEILNNVPFFLPFSTRVRILQEYIKLDSKSLSHHFLLPGGGVAVRRNHILEDGYLAFKNLGHSYKDRLNVSFYDQFGVPEPGIDGGGLTKEFITCVCKEGFNPLAGLFAANDDHLLYPEPSIAIPENVESSLSWEERMDKLDYFEFLGKVIGKSLYEGIQVNVEFAPFFLLKWSGRQSRNSFDDLYSLDPQLYDSLVKLHEYPGDVENDLTLDFTIMQDVGGNKQAVVELKPHGSDVAVTNKNRLEYIHAIANYKLNTVLAPQTRAFLKGVHELIAPHWLSMFNASELQLLISGGTSGIDIQDLKAHTVYSGLYGANDPFIRDFWEVVEEMDEEDRRNLVQFVTSVPKGPLLGFAELKPKFAIRDTGPAIDRLPSAATCFNLLKLPYYKDKEVLRDRLLYAIRSKAGFNFS